MKRTASQVLSASGLIVLLFLLTVSLSEPGRAQSQAKPQASTQAPAQPGWLSVQVVSVKPDMLTEWQDLQKNETIPALKKGGSKWREAWQTAVFGPSYQYALVSPIDSLVQLDGDSPMLKALGQEGLRTYGVKLRRLIASSRTYGVRPRGDLSYLPQVAGPPKLAVLNFISVAPGRFVEYESYIKNDILPIMKQAKVAGLAVSQTIFGGDGNEYVTATFYDSFAEIDKGPPAVRVLGQEAANKLAQKTAGVVMRVERIIIRFNADLSFGLPAQAKSQ